MAVWQFAIDFVPEQFLLDTYGYIPSNMPPEDYKKGDFFRTTPCLIEELLPYLKSFGEFDQHSWNGTRLYHGEGDHDAVVYFEEDTGQITMVSCRVDMRRPQEGFLYSILALANAFDWYLVVRGGKRLFTPTVADLHLAMAQSNAWRFVTDPLKFLTDLSKGDTPATLE